MQHKKVLLIGWDAADWKVIHPLMEQGKMPGMKTLVEHGTMSEMMTLHPIFSGFLVPTHWRGNPFSTH
ncbi:hypothetical protein QUF74_03245 [Candidatus Halobeggiatoa sp. HSG11]|nr:hypothetical protein [Candidatus Halobeggiatoa sp. HSG11]